MSEINLSLARTPSTTGRRSTSDCWSYRARHIDWEIGSQLLRAQRAGCQVRLGFGSLLEYADRLLGYSAHTTTERLRVASALEDLPQTTQALRSGEVSFSAVRELTRVATPETEAKWLAGARQKTVREVERRATRSISVRSTPAW